jgi:hypothetical protein
MPLGLGLDRPHRPRPPSRPVRHQQWWLLVRRRRGRSWASVRCAQPRTFGAGTASKPADVRRGECRRMDNGCDEPQASDLEACGQAIDAFSSNHSSASGSDVKNRVGTGWPPLPIPGPKLACTRSTGDSPNKAIRVTVDCRPTHARASGVVATPIIRTSNGRRQAPLNWSTDVIAAAASAPVMRVPGVHRTRRIPRDVTETRNAVSGIVPLLRAPQHIGPTLVHQQRHGGVARSGCP